jgi:hypothetical protein
MTDKFMSGWGQAQGKLNKYVVRCDTLEQAECIYKNAQMRDEMKNINYGRKLPYFSESKYKVTMKTWDQLGYVWKTGCKWQNEDDYYADPRRMSPNRRRGLRRNPSFERTLRSSASMTPAVFSATMRGNLSSELMVRSWNQKKLVRGVIFKYKIDPNHYYFIFEEPGIYRSEPYTIAEATTGLTLGGTGSFKQIIEDGEEKIRKFIASKGKRKYDSLIASAEKLNHIGR